MTVPKLLPLLFACMLTSMILTAQDSSKVYKFISLPDKLFLQIDKKAAFIDNKLNKQTGRYLAKLQKKENQLKKKLWKKDSTLAKQLFNGVDDKYDQLRNTTVNTARYQNAYSGHLDSLSTALNFINGQNAVSNPSIQKTLTEYASIQSRLNQSNRIKDYLTQRQQQLKQRFAELGMVKELKKYRKTVYYYQQQVREYKELFENPKKAEAKIMELVMKHTKFRGFFAENSILGSVFGLPSANSPPTTSFTGLQTRAQVNQILAASFGNAAGAASQLQQSIQSAGPSFGGPSIKLPNVSSGAIGNSSDAEIPGFKPNSQKTKSFFRRLEYGANIQSQKARLMFPVTSDIAFTIGYRINDRSSIGIGASYKLGWGSSWSKIRITHQGMGLRSYLDWKIKGSFYLSGGYEQNYRNLIRSMVQLQNYSAWQTSGLIGISKKYSVSKKMKGDVKLLWDFMSYQQTPRSQPILFRIGYNLK